MSIKLTDTQLVILSAAAQRENRCLIAPKSLKGASAQKVASKLLAAGLVKEIKAKPGIPAWRRDDEAGHAFALKLTATGMKAIAVDDEGDRPPTAGAPCKPAESPFEENEDAQTARSPMRSMWAPREGTKMARIIGLLQREDGATLAELVAATDWLPHTTRAALTGLRKLGYPVTLDRSDRERGSTYFILRDHSFADVDPEVATLDRPPAPAARSKKAAGLSNPEPAGVTTAGAAA